MSMMLIKMMDALDLKIFTFITEVVHTVETSLALPVMEMELISLEADVRALLFPKLLAFKNGTITSFILGTL